MHMPAFDPFFRDLDTVWQRPTEDRIALKVLGSAALALGVGVEKTHEVLAKLERSVTAMLELRKSTVVHRDGSVDAGDAGDGSDAGSSDNTAPITLQFAGATFDQADSSDPSILRFISDDDYAKASASALESMGVAGRWQQAGPVEVSIENHGPPGKAVSIRLKVPGGLDLADAAKALVGIGIELGQ